MSLNTVRSFVLCNALMERCVGYTKLEVLAALSGALRSLLDGKDNMSEEDIIAAFLSTRRLKFRPPEGQNGPTLVGLPPPT